MPNQTIIIMRRLLMMFQKFVQSRRNIPTILKNSVSFRLLLSAASLRLCQPGIKDQDLNLLLHPNYLYN